MTTEEEFVSDFFRSKFVLRNFYSNKSFSVDDSESVNVFLMIVGDLQQTDLQGLTANIKIVNTVNFLRRKFRLF